MPIRDESGALDGKMQSLKIGEAELKYFGRGSALLDRAQNAAGAELWCESECQPRDAVFCQRRERLLVRCCGNSHDVE
jgi:hypothetical protein